MAIASRPSGTTMSIGWMGCPSSLTRLSITDAPCGYSMSPHRHCPPTTVAGVSAGPRAMSNIGETGLLGSAPLVGGRDQEARAPESAPSHGSLRSSARKSLLVRAAALTTGAGRSALRAGRSLALLGLVGTRSALASTVLASAALGATGHAVTGLAAAATGHAGAALALGVAILLGTGRAALGHGVALLLVFQARKAAVFRAALAAHGAALATALAAALVSLVARHRAPP